VDLRIIQRVSCSWSVRCSVLLLTNNDEFVFYAKALLIKMRTDW